MATLRLPTGDRRRMHMNVRQALGTVHLLACRGADPSMVGAIIFQKKIKGGP